MRAFYKISILILAISFIVGVIIFYLQTKVMLPTIPKSVNQYSLFLESYTHEFKQMNDKPSLDKQLLTRIYTHIKVFQSENKIKRHEADTNIELIVDIYAPRFIKWSMSRFNSSTWSASEHTYMITTIDYLENMLLSNNQNCITKEEKKSFNQIKDIINKYNTALNLTRENAYRNLAHAEQTINDTNLFMTDKYLSNCKSLVHDLKQVKINLAESHYKYISKEVERLSQYRNYSYENYNKFLLPHIDRVVEDNSNAIRLYGNKKSLKHILDRAISYHNSAEEYYDI